MPTVTITNTDANLSAKTVVVAENSQTVTGLHTYDRDPNPPFAVSSGSAVVPNLDADKVDGKHSTDLVLVDGTQAMTGTFNLGTPGKIQFPAAQSASSGANVLDDYEEGTWTPTIGGSNGQSGQVHTTQFGSYVKIGQLVLASFNVALSTLGTINTNVQIKGLPFTVNSLDANYAATTTHINWSNLSAGGYVNVIGAAVGGETAITIYVLSSASASSSSAAVQANLTNTSQFVGQILYRASA